MPVLFVVMGIFLISILFEVFLFKSRIDKWCLFVILIIAMSGYFFSDIFVLSVSFNVLHFLSFLILFFYLNSKVRILIVDIVFFVLLGIFYYLLLKKDLSLMLRYSSLVCLFNVFIVVLFYSIKLYKTALIALLSSLVLVVLSGVDSFDNFGLVELDFLFCLEVVFYSCFFCVFRLLLSKLLIENILWRRYDKEINFLYYSYSYRFNFLQ